MKDQSATNRKEAFIHLQTMLHAKGGARVMIRLVVKTLAVPSVTVTNTAGLSQHGVGGNPQPGYPVMDVP